jgi:hypothetical protein
MNTFWCWTGQGEKTLEVTAGQTIDMKGSIPHAWGNPTDKPIGDYGYTGVLRILSKGG